MMGGLAGHPFKRGVVKFTKSADHATVTNYIVRIYEYQTSNIVASKSFGKPTPYANGDILVDVNDLLATLTSPANYSVTIVAQSALGSTESAVDDFSLPLT